MFAFLRLPPIAMLAAFCLVPLSGRAEESPARPPSVQAPLHIDPSSVTEGPKKLSLAHGVVLDLPEGVHFFDQRSSDLILKRRGHKHNDNVLGIIEPGAEDQEWEVVVSFDDDGHIADDETLKPDDILESLKEGLDDYNEERKKEGFEPLSLTGWAEPPHYDTTSHHMVWGLNVSSPSGTTVNYNTRVLARTGYVSLNLLSDPDKLQSAKVAAAGLLSSASFAPGSRYADFDKKKDKVAEYGLTGLIAAGAGLGAVKLVKLGLLAKFSKVILAALLAGKKAIVLLALGLWAGLKKLLGIKSKNAEAEQSANEAHSLATSSAEGPSENGAVASAESPIAAVTAPSASTGEDPK